MSPVSRLLGECTRHFEQCARTPPRVNRSHRCNSASSATGKQVGQSSDKLGDRRVSDNDGQANRECGLICPMAYITLSLCDCWDICVEMLYTVMFACWQQVDVVHYDVFVWLSGVVCNETSECRCLHSGRSCCVDVDCCTRSHLDPAHQHHTCNYIVVPAFFGSTELGYGRSGYMNV